MDTDDQSAMIPPRYQRLSDELAEAIHGGRLPVGSRLPSLRQMALQRKLSLNTVIAAYRQLEDAGLVIPRPKAGFEVAPRLSVPERSLRATPSAPTAPLQQVLMARVLEAQRRPGVIDLAFAGPRGRQFYPGAQLARHTAQVLRHGQQTVETYARPNGSPRLLAQIVRRGPRMGLHTHSERLLLTHGAMEALQLALRAVTQPGDAVGIEAPSYFNLYPLLANLGLQAIELPTHPQHGLDVDALDALLEHTPLAALVVMPTVHNPLGCTMPTAAKQRLAELVNARQLPLIEDAVYAELQFCEPPAPLLKAFDRDGWVMVVGGFSKTLAPDYRIGWLDGGRFAERIALLKFQSTGGEPQLLGDAVAAYLEAGSYEHHLHRMRRLYREQVGRLRQLVAEHFPAGTRATEPQGGFLLWLELPGVDTRELFERALAEDIVFMPGQVYSRGARYRHCLRLSCCQTLDARFIGAVERLGAIAKELAAAALPQVVEQVRRQRFAIRTRQMRQPPPARHRQALLQRGDVLVLALHRRVDVVADPAQALHAAGLQRLRGQPRMVDAAQPHAHHHQHGQLQCTHQVQLVQRGRDWRQPTAHALHHHNVGPRSQTFERGHDRRQLHLHAILGSGQLWRQRLPQRVRVQVGIVRHRPAGRLQCQRVLVAQALPQVFAATGHRLHAHRTQAAPAQCM